MNSQAIKHIVIVGGGTSGWSAATGLARGLQMQKPHITVIEDNPLPEPAITIASPHIFDFHQNMGIHDQHLLQQKQAMLSCARYYRGWQTAPQDVFIGNNTHLPVFKGIELHHLIKRCEQTNYQDYSLAAMAARQHKLAVSNQQRGTLLGSFNSGMHLVTQAYLRFMCGAAQHLGVRSTTSAIVSVKRDPSSGFITQLTLQSGEVLAVDLIIDNSGVDSRIMQGEFQIPYQLAPSPFDNVIELQQTTTLPSCNYSTLTATQAGWLEQSNLQGKQQSLLWCNSDEITDEQLYQWLNINADDELALVRHPISPGKRQQLFYKNCVAIGDTAGYAGSPSINNVVMTQRAIGRLLDLFPTRQCFESNAGEYNRLMDNDYAEALDYLDLHHYLISKNTRLADCNWAKTSAELSAKLQQKIDLFNHYGRFEDELNQIITRQNWINLLLLCCQDSNRYEPLLDIYTTQEIQQFLTTVRQDVEQHIYQLPTLQE
ncbi:FAD-dependent oxidoreductase [Neptunicella sp. SCSIO 80796]|uniref:FAD-dependent oxidoreductase n=1 Tax=Neptunicella plasticusilytica TaxID=3117012 RepID=UPI003A4DBFED